jgi:hypothetical protein
MRKKNNHRNFWLWIPICNNPISSEFKTHKGIRGRVRYSKHRMRIQRKMRIAFNALLLR